MSITWQFQLWTMSLRNAMTEQNALLLSKVVKSMDKMETKHTYTNMAYLYRRIVRLICLVLPTDVLPTYTRSGNFEIPTNCSLELFTD